MTRNWYYRSGEAARGPISVHELKGLTRTGEIQPGDLVRKDGASDWVPASKVKGLFPTPPPLPAVPPAPKASPTESPARAGAPVPPAVAVVPLAEESNGFAFDDICENSGKKQTTRPHSRIPFNVGAGVVSALLLSCLACAGISTLLLGRSEVSDPKQAIVGTWKQDGGAVWVFHPDGTLTTRSTRAKTKSMYTIVAKDKLEITYSHTNRQMFQRILDNGPGDMPELNKAAWYEAMRKMIDEASRKPDYDQPVKELHQFKFDGRDRLIMLWSSDKNGPPTRIEEAVRANKDRLYGKGGGLVTELRRQSAEAAKEESRQLELETQREKARLEQQREAERVKDEEARRQAEAAKERTRQLELEAQREKARLEQQQEAERIKEEERVREAAERARVAKRQADIAGHHERIAELSATIKKVQGRIELVKKAQIKPRPEVDGVAVTPLDSLTDVAYTYYTDAQKEKRLAGLEKELQGLGKDKKDQEEALRRLGG